MRRVFVDTVYWLAIFVPGDTWSDAAHALDCSDAFFITTEEVLSEFLAAVPAHGDRTRRLACRLVREILNDSDTEVVSQSLNLSSPVWRFTKGVPTKSTVSPTASP